VNAGSSSLKLRVVEDGREAGKADLPALDPAAREGQRSVRHAIERLGRVDAVGHRIVHGGADFTSAAVIDDEVMRRIIALTDLAPLHQPACIAGWRIASTLLPGVPHVACFDTAFHAALPAPAATYAVPVEWRERWSIRRYGFHGLSHGYASRRAAELLDRSPEGLRLVTAHLGAGASLAAVSSGRSVDTTMGFTPLEGLVMATRSGSVDPGLVLWLQQRGGLTAEAVAEGLEHSAGLLGLAGTADMREVLARADSDGGDARTASLARDVYVHRLRAAVAAMTSSLGGLDALVFTGGVGENSASIRALAVEGLAYLGLAIDTRRNERQAGDRLVSPPGAPAAVLAVASREELEIARQVEAALGS